MLKYLKVTKTKLFSDITTVPEILQGKYYSSLDGLRAIAILMVMLAHFGADTILLHYNLLIDSEIGVHIFFVLSGFLITTQLIKEKLRTGNISVKRFYTRRILRIVPLAYLFLIVLVIISVCYYRMSTKSDFIYSFLFLKNLPIKNQPFTAHLWTLSVEEQFYIILPLLMYLGIKKYFNFALLVVIFVPLLSILAFNSIGYPFTNHIFELIIKFIMYSFWKGPTIILISSVFSILTFKGIIKSEPNNKHYFLSFFLLILAILISTRTFILYSKYTSEYISSIIIAYVILLNIRSQNFLSKILSNRILVKIGILSYSIYMWQQIFIGKFFWIPWLKELNSLPLIFIIALKLVFMIPIAYISYYLFETPFLKLKERFK
ncbi:Peptidoglycan/LPS O-acetylase OafA/YrhL, contains acyltransferase and SGNH-hydrolase domains [Mucilaginibacter mallensis]|uniref:Peptidoglycan/LPS O-acetylase OafA/YrhL, contains acyltransferase and SGNH-hydrolase domains n=1 Tax=Mucilaginibacter mallensis TaxID=652787 RepID=A0A1H1WIN1_MUCMA|nr:acyltransferase [Mucilaginibacter mallensis]SDS97177.1 Peptidoglycan/LPS O-acetylase OafA/YrhL, contains acyltransferase and SGNH-hydrolase domains [Mucilaginibacter mallensis]